MVRLLISGYYGCGNAGDEAVLAGLVAGLRARLGPGLGLTVLSGDPPDTATRYRVEAVPRASFGAVCRALGRADALISGGGGLFQDASGPASPLYYGGLIVLARLRRRPVVAVGQGIGPLRRRLSRAACRLALRACAYVAVRDPESQALLAAMGVDSALGADLAYLLPAPSPEAVKAAWEKAGGRPEGPVVGVSLRPLPGAGESENLLAACAQALNGLSGVTALLLPFQPGLDTLPLAHLAGRLAIPHRLVETPLEPEALLALAADLQAMVAMRLHALILAARAGTVPVGISYDPKVDAFLARLGLAAATRADQPEPAPLADAVEHALRSGVPPGLASANAALVAAAGRMLDDACSRLTCPH